VRQALERSLTALSDQASLKELKNCYASLTARERQVMALVVSGLLNKQVGGELGISEITVKAHRGKVMGKMNAGSLAELVKIASRLGIAAVSPPPAVPSTIASSPNGALSRT
jgi:FixJ family two-component response regulator